MSYHYDYQTTPFDLWQISMKGIYRSMVGLVNLIFTIAMVLLIFRYYTEVNLLLKLFLILGLSLFTLIQPTAIYLRAKKQLNTSPKRIDIVFDDNGVHVNAAGESSDIKWKRIQKIVKQPGTLIIYSSQKHGFVLPNRVLGTDKEKLYEFVISKLNH